MKTLAVNSRNSYLPLFIRTPSFTTRGIDEDGVDAATDFGADVDMGAEDAPERGRLTLGVQT